MARFLGRLFSGQSETGELLLRAYGKLPMYAEYRRLEVSPGTATTFSQWLDDGRLAWIKATVDGVRGAPRGARAVLQWPDSRECVVANVWDSRDSLGRTFPFAFFVVCPGEWLGKDWAQRWVTCAAIHAQLDEAHARLGALGMGGDFYRVYRQQAILANVADLEQRVEALRREADGFDLVKWFAAAELAGQSGGPWFAGLARRAGQWRSGAAVLGELGVSVPLAAGFSPEAQGVLWLDWLAALAGPAARPPSLIGPGADAAAAAAGRLHVIFRPPLPGDFQLLTEDAAGYGYVDHLATVGAGTAANAAGAVVGVAAPAGSLREALTRLTTR
jgi:hypothetical protein